MNDENNDAYIQSDKILGGIYSSLINAQDHADAAYHLYHKNWFQQSIPLSIISYEESSKADFLISFFNDKKHVTKDHWNDIKHHNFKLSRFEQKIIDSIPNCSEHEIDFFEGFLKDNLGIEKNWSLKNSIDDRKSLLTDLKKLQRLKEICLYCDWNVKKKTWNNFTALPKNYQKSLAYLTITFAEDIYYKTKYALDIYENPPQPSGIKHMKLDKKTNTINHNS